MGFLNNIDAPCAYCNIDNNAPPLEAFSSNEDRMEWFKRERILATMQAYHDDYVDWLEHKRHVIKTAQKFERVEHASHYGWISNSHLGPNKYAFGRIAANYHPLYTNRMLMWQCVSLELILVKDKILRMELLNLRTELRTEFVIVTDVYKDPDTSNHVHWFYHNHLYIIVATSDRTLPTREFWCQFPCHTRLGHVTTQMQLDYGFSSDFVDDPGEDDADTDMEEFEDDFCIPTVYSEAEESLEEDLHRYRFGEEVNENLMDEDEYERIMAEQAMEDTRIFEKFKNRKPPEKAEPFDYDDKLASSHLDEIEQSFVPLPVQDSKQIEEDGFDIFALIKKLKGYLPDLSEENATKIEGLIILAIGFFRVDYEGKFWMLVNYAHRFVRGSAFYYVMKLIKRFKSEWEPTSFISDSLDVLNKSLTFLKGSLWKTMVKIFTTLFSVLCVSEETAERLDFIGIIDKKQFFVPQDKKPIDFLITVGESVQSILMIAQGETFIGSEQDVKTFIQEVEWLKRYKYKTSYRVPLPKGMVSRHNWVQKLDSVADKYLKFKSLKLNSTLQSLFLIAIREIRDMKEDILSLLKSERFKCFNLGIIGGSGTGKSTTVAKEVARVVLAASEVEWDESSIRDQNIGDKYLSTYSPEVLAPIYDEIGAYKGASTNSDNFVYGNILQMLSHAECNVTRAKIDDKGKCSYNPVTNILISNKNDLGITDLLTHPDAFFRRLNYTLIVRVIKDYRKEGSSEIDPVAARDVVDIYEIDICIPKGTKWVPIKTNLSLTDTLEFLFKAARVYWSIQAEITNKPLLTSTFCKHCGKISCICAAPTGFTKVKIPYYGSSWWNRLKYKFKIGFHEFVYSYTKHCPNWLLAGIARSVICSKAQKERAKYMRLLSMEKAMNESSELDQCIDLMDKYTLMGLAGTAFGVIGGITALVWLLKKEKATATGNAVSLPVTIIPSVQKINQINAWEASVPKLVFPTARTPEENFVNLLSANLFYATVDFGSGREWSQALALDDQKLLMARHTLSRFDDKATLRLSKPVNGTLNTICSLKGCKVENCGDDLAIVHTRALTKVKDIKKYIITGSHSGSADVSHIFLPFHENITSDVPLIQNVKCNTMNIIIKDIQAEYKMLFGPGQSFTGQCGSPAFMKNNKGEIGIIGINTAGKPAEGKVGFHYLSSLSSLSKLSIEAFPTGFTYLCGTEEAVSTGRHEDQLPEYKIKSCLTFIESSRCALEFVKTVKPRVGRLRSHVRATKISKSWFEMFPQCRHNLTKPIFGPVRVDGVYYCPLKNALNDLVDPISNIHEGHLEEAIQCVLKRFDDDTWLQDRTLTEHEALNGIDGNPLAKKIDINTSAGGIFPGLKKDYIRGEVKNYELTQKMRDAVNDMLALYKEGQAHPIFTVALKDEPRAQEKVDLRKIRVFSPCPMDYYLIQKMCFGVQLNLWMRHDNAETVGGINCFSPKWTELRKRLTHEYVICGDFSKFDKKLSGLLTSAAILILVTLKPVDPVQREFFWRVAYDSCFVTYWVRETIFRIYGSNPSGNLLTFYLNNMANALLIRMGWMLITEESLQVFEVNVVLLLCGDDNLINISSSVSSVFNFKALKSYFSDIGIVYTMADKSDGTYLYSPVEEATIVKRTWRYDEDFGLYCCPIEWQSIGKMMTMTNDRTTETEDMRLQQSAISAAYEFSQYGKIVFEESIVKMKQIFNRHDIPCPKIPTFNEIVARFKESTLEYVNLGNIYDYEHPGDFSSNQFIEVF